MLFWHSDSDLHAEVGYVLHPDHEGHGYATEGTRALLALCFEEAGAHRVTARLDERNTASARLLERLGFRQRGDVRRGREVQGRVDHPGGLRDARPRVGSEDSRM